MAAGVAKHKSAGQKFVSYDACRQTLRKFAGASKRNVSAAKCGGCMSE